MNSQKTAFMCQFCYLFLLNEVIKVILVGEGSPGCGPRNPGWPTARKPRSKILSGKKCYFSVCRRFSYHIWMHACWSSLCQVLQKGGFVTCVLLFVIHLDQLWRIYYKEENTFEMLSIEFFFHQGVDKVGEAFEKKNNPHIEQLTLRE